MTPLHPDRENVIAFDRERKSSRIRVTSNVRETRFVKISFGEGPDTKTGFCAR